MTTPGLYLVTWGPLQQAIVHDPAAPFEAGLYAQILSRLGLLGEFQNRMLSLQNSVFIVLENDKQTFKATKSNPPSTEHACIFSMTPKRDTLWDAVCNLPAFRDPRWGEVQGMA